MLDSATRLLRCSIEEISESTRVRLLGNRYASSRLTVAMTIKMARFSVDLFVEIVSRNPLRDAVEGKMLPVIVPMQ